MELCSRARFTNNKGVLAHKILRTSGICAQDKREVPAWSERRQYAELAAEYGGYHLPSKSDQAQGGGGVILILPGGQPQSTPVVPVDRKVVDAVPNAVNPVQNLLNGEEADGQDSY
jgi:hypothetical protein